MGVSVTSQARVLLAAAIGLEVIGTLSLRLSEGFTEPTWTVLVVLGYISSIIVFGRALSLGMGLGVAYATLTGVGLIAAALASALLFDEGFSQLDACGLILLLVGVLLLQRRTTSPEPGAETDGP